MIYDGRPNNGRDGQWHCPFSPEWVSMMRKAVKYCEHLSAEYIARRISNEEYIYPNGDFLSEPQDSRGLPVWYNDNIIIRRLPISCDIYDYSTIPNVVVTDGREDWPLCLRGSMLMA
jgi:hypothetical protein